MEEHNLNQPTDRRGFLGSLATGAAALGIASFATPLGLKAEANKLSENGFDPDPDELFKKLKGKHKVVFDATRPHEIMPFVWPKVFLLTNQATGTPEKENSVVVVLRHDAIPFAFQDHIWEKYKFGDLFKVEVGRTFHAADAATAASVRNPFWKTKKGDFMVPGFGEVQIGISELQASGVIFVVCDAAMTVYSAAVAQGMNLNAADVKKEWISGLIPGIQPVPSGVWALGRAQEHGCSYIFAG
ncbi:MAG: twin-arginine translocation signal domain-containing protein [Bacteroidota bacterium]|nr:twin-arginine translocation signal domain-containing protein [Bacteroidota bacterium]